MSCISEGKKSGKPNFRIILQTPCNMFYYLYERFVNYFFPPKPQTPNIHMMSSIERLNRVKFYESLPINKSQPSLPIDSTNEQKEDFEQTDRTKLMNQSLVVSAAGKRGWKRRRKCLKSNGYYSSSPQCREPKFHPEMDYSLD